jgi:hypothetical protein
MHSDGIHYIEYIDIPSELPKPKPMEKTVKQMMGIPWKFDDLIRNMALVYVIAEFEAFLGNILRTTFDKCPSCLSSSKRTLNNEEIVSKNQNIGKIVNALIEKEVDEVLRKDIQDIDNYFIERFKIGLSEHASNWVELKERFYRRNIILHNSRLVNAEYRRKTGYKGRTKEMDVSEKYLRESIVAFKLLSLKIIGEFHKKFAKSNCFIF